MTTNFPSSIDAFTNPTSADTLDNPPHDQQHADINDAMEAVQTSLLDGAPLHIDDANERVGVGTTSPSTLLHVGDETVSDNIVTVTAANNTSAGVDLMGDLSGAKGFRVKYEGDGNYFAVEDNTSGVQTERLRIDSSGNVGINDTTPSYKLDVDGDINATGDVRVAGNPVGMVLIDTFSGTSATSASFDNVFSSDFDNYKVIVNTRYLSNVLYFRFRAGGTDNSAGSYAWNTRGTSAINNSLDWYSDSDTFAGLLYNNYPTSTARAQATFDVLYPHASEFSIVLGSSSGYSTGGNTYHNTLGITHYSESSFDGFTIFTNNASNFVNYTVSVYGYVI